MCVHATYQQWEHGTSLPQEDVLDLRRFLTSGLPARHQHTAMTESDMFRLQEVRRYFNLSPY